MIGLMPCAGMATRIQGLPKYLLPVGDSYLLRILATRLRESCDQIFIGCNHENAELIHRYDPTSFTYIPTSYKTMSETVLAGRKWADGRNVLFGMPDTFVEDDTCFPKLTAALADGAHVAVALFHARPRQHLKAGMCDTKGNQVVEVVDKPDSTTFTRLWGALAWKPAFWEHLRPEDPHVGYALPRAIAAGLDVRAVRMDGQYFDCGTTAEYFDLVTHLHGRKEAAEMQQIYG